MCTHKYVVFSGRPFLAQVGSTSRLFILVGDEKAIQWNMELDEWTDSTPFPERKKIQDIGGIKNSGGDILCKYPTLTVKKNNLETI